MFISTSCAIALAQKYEKKDKNRKTENEKIEVEMKKY